MNLFSKNHKYIKENSELFKIKSGHCPYTKNYTILKSKSGDNSLQLSANNRTITIHGLYNPKRDAERKISDFDSQNEILLVFGSCLGYELQLLDKKFAKPIIVIEPDKNLFNSMCKTIDLSDLNNCSFVVGYFPFELKDKIVNDKSCDLFYNSARFEIDKSYFESALRDLQGLSNFNLSDQWKYKKFIDSTTKVLFIDSAYVLTQECLTGLQEAGCEVKYIHIDSEKQSYDGFIKNFLTTVADFKPDFVLTINHLGFDQEGRLTELLSSIEMPFVSWFVDSPTVILTSFDQNISDFCNLFIWDSDYINELQDCGYSNVDYLPLATLPTLFKPLNIPYTSDVAFVGSSMIYSIHKNMKRMIMRPDLLQLLEKTADRFLTMDTRNSVDAIEAIQSEGINYNFTSSDQKADFAAAVTWRATQKYRLSGLMKLAEFNPTVHGDPHWDFILDDRFRIEREIMYYQQMPQFYNSAKIQFNMTSRQMRYAVNQRVFDVPATQQFLLTDYKMQLEEIFDIGKDIICFEDIEEIPELIRYYLNNDNKRKEVSTRGYRTILNGHTYKHRLTKLVEIIRRRYKAI
jgi:spore maturation protein CgeB